MHKQHQFNQIRPESVEANEVPPPETNKVVKRISETTPEHVKIKKSC